MSTFNEREETFEKKFIHDDDMQFKAAARRNKLLGLWAAELMGKTGDEADAYAAEVVKSDLAEAGEDDVFGKVFGDLDGRVDEVTLRTKMVELMAVAKAEVFDEA